MYNFSQIIRTANCLINIDFETLLSCRRRIKERVNLPIKLVIRLQAVKKTKAVKDRFDETGGNKKTVNVLDEAAMENAYNICHNVQDLLYFRGFFWEGQGGKKGKGKGRKGKKKK